uniref:VP2 protein n=1 Tax=Fish-associated calicivirus TaxID=3003964 RepID=A0A9E9JNA5_9CALI|nr:MAG: VP2 protein [Fish-associated calicivirus]
MAGIAGAAGIGIITSIIDAATSLGVAGIQQQATLETQARDFGFRRGIIREHQEALGKSGLPGFIAYGGASHGLLEPYKVSIAAGSHVGKSSIINNSFGHVPNQFGNYRRTSSGPAMIVRKR